jgi:hypothetical protein
LGQLAEGRPSGQFAEGDEGDADLGAEQFAQQRWREWSLMLSEATSVSRMTRRISQAPFERRMA